MGSHYGLWHVNKAQFYNFAHLLVKAQLFIYLLPNLE